MGFWTKNIVQYAENWISPLEWMVTGLVTLIHACAPDPFGWLLSFGACC